MPCLQWCVRASEDRSLTHNARALNLSLACVHVASLAADKSLIHFHISSKLADRPVLNRKANAMQHEPRGFLSHPERTSDFARTATVLSVDNHPESSQPLIQAD